MTILFYAAMAAKVLAVLVCSALLYYFAERAWRVK